MDLERGASGGKLLAGAVSLSVVVVVAACQADPRPPGTAQGFVGGDRTGVGAGLGGSRGSDTASPGSGDGSAPPQDAASQACAALCALESECSGQADLRCLERCLFTVDVFDGACREDSIDELDCAAGLSCEELAAYATGRRRHAQCGALASGFFQRCTYGSAPISDACTRVCQADIGCALEPAPLARCEEDCTLELTGLALEQGPGCAEAHERYLDCLALQDCDTLAGAGAPDACAGLDADADAACH